jgi:hypothetical protein
MAYADDVKSLAWWEKVRIVSLGIALLLLFVGLYLETRLGVPRFFAWSTAGVASVCEGRAAKRLGRDPWAYWLRAGLFFLVGISVFFW